MTIEMLKAEITRLNKAGKAVVSPVHRCALASEEEVEPLAENQKKTLLHRWDVLLKTNLTSVSKA